MTPLGAFLQGLQKPIYQIMASGMHPSTAVGLDACDESELCCGWNHDSDGLRGAGRACTTYGQPNFGVAEFDWEARVLHLRIMRGDGRGVAAGVDGTVIKMDISIETCQQV